MILNNKIGFKPVLSLVIGNIIGVGIFTTTGYVSNYLDSPFLIFILWILGGIYAISGAIVYGVLAKEHPLSGGDFQYLKAELHPLFGYMFGWSALTITYTGSIAALTIGAAYYFNSVFNLKIVSELNIYISVFNDEKFIAIFLVLFFSWINYRGIKISTKYQTILTAFIISFIVVFSILGIFTVNNSPISSISDSTEFDIYSFLTAFIAVIFTYIGWTSAVYIAEEIDEPKVLIPKSLLYGVLIVTTLYLLINFLFLYSLPVLELKGNINVATLVSEHLWGGAIATVVSFCIFVAILSTINSTILSGSRIYMAMSREGYLFGKLSEYHIKFKTPHKAIMIQAIWSIILIISGSFNQLLSFVVFVIMVFSTLAGIMSVRIYIRKRINNYFKLLCLLIYTLICLIVSINTLSTRFTESMIGLIIIFISILFYMIEKNQFIKN